MEIRCNRPVATSALDEWLATSESTEPRGWIWQPSHRVTFGPRDRQQPGYDEARRIARSHGYAVADRSFGGRAVATNRDTLSILIVGPLADTGIQDRYDAVLETLESALSAVGYSVSRNCPPQSFCPGGCGLATTGKVVGLAQRVRGETAAVGGLVIVRNRAAILRVLEPVYAALDIPLDVEAVGSLTTIETDPDPEKIGNIMAEHLRERGVPGWA